MKRNILLQFDDEDDYADVIVAIRMAHGSPTKDPGERAVLVAEICRFYRDGPAPIKPIPNGAPLPGQMSLLPDPKGA